MKGFDGTELSAVMQLIGLLEPHNSNMQEVQTTTWQINPQTQGSGAAYRPTRQDTMWPKGRDGGEIGWVGVGEEAVPYLEAWACEEPSLK